MKEGPGLVGKKQTMKHLQVGNAPQREPQLFLIIGVSFPGTQTLKSPIIGLENIWGQGAHFQGGTRPEASISGKSISSSFPPLPDRDTQPHAPHSAHLPSPPISGACARGPGGGWPQGEGLASPSLASFPHLRRGATAARPGPGAAREGGTHLGNVTCCPAQGSLQVPGAGRPSLAQAPAASAAPPAPAPAPPRPAAREGPGSPTSFR